MTASTDANTATVVPRPAGGGGGGSAADSMRGAGDPPSPAPARREGDQVAVLLRAARAAQRRWEATPVRERLAVVRRARHLLADRADPVARAIAAAHPKRRGRGDAGVAETLTAEVLPTAAACRFLEREAAGLLRPRRRSRRGRPAWLIGHRAVVHRVPFGVVLVIGPGNYPFMLVAVQAVQALAAGNAVVLKPGREASVAADALKRLLDDAGLPEQLLSVLSEDVADAQAAMRARDDEAGRPLVDRVVLTGSVDSGRAVLGELADAVVPTTMELSGEDAFIVLDGADLDLAARALRFGRRLNGGETCIRPRRVLVHANVFDRFADRWAGDGVAPQRFTTPDDAVETANGSPYGLGASVFGPPAAAAAVAARLDVGVVTLNETIVPTADPRLPFGGRGDSGFGVTRGAEGLLEMTRPKVVTRQGGVCRRFRPHYDEPTSHDAEAFAATIRALYGRGAATRWRAAVAAIKALRKRSAS